MRWKVPAAIVLLVVGVGAVVFAITGGPGGSRASGPQYLTATATSGDIAQTVDATGTLTRATTYGLDFGAAPAAIDASSTGGSGSGTWSVKEVKVAVGDTVKKGAVLAKADATTLERNLSARRVEPPRREEPEDHRQGATSTPRSGPMPGARPGSATTTPPRSTSRPRATSADLREQVARTTIVAPADGTVTAVAAVAGTDLTERPGDHAGQRPAAGHRRLHRDGPAVAQARPARRRSRSTPSARTSPARSSRSHRRRRARPGSVVTYAVTIELTDAAGGGPAGDERERSGHDRGGVRGDLASPPSR